MRTMVRFENVTREFKNGKGIHGCSFEAEENEVTGIIGPNGSGKTTIFRIIAGLQRYDGGKVVLDGIPAEEYPLGNIGYMPEERTVRKAVSVYEMVLLVGRLKGIRKDRAPKAADDAIEKTGLERVKYERMTELSKGNANLAMYACAIVHDPKILILDEPFSGLDAENREKMMKLIREGRTGRTTIVSVHEQYRIPELCDKVFKIREGKIEEVYRP
ncbi:MAG: ATP-binding cassette domain-containing protein [Erysipelotrichales bacterium]|nr:ATP-binding cassette domain-containing protein [Erysipelotrichales bacterium]